MVSSASIKSSIGGFIDFQLPGGCHCASTGWLLPPDNFGRAANFKIQGNSYITTSCKDTKTQCNIKIDGKAVGGYAWTYSGWFGYYHYITLCTTFFTIDTLDTQLQQREAELAAGGTSKVTDMRYLKSTGQFFLHEMMHTQLVGQPHSKSL
jgi:hypothetical protein